MNIEIEKRIMFKNNSVGTIGNNNYSIQKSIYFQSGILKMDREKFREINFKNIHIMFDVETLSTSNIQPLVFVIGMVIFLEDGTIVSQHKWNLDIQQSLDKGFKIDKETLLWWLEQKNIFDVLVNGQKNIVFEIKQCLEQMSSVLLSLPYDEKEIKIWSNGQIDLRALRQYYEVFGIKLPWKHFQERCVRTIVDLNPEIKKSVIEENKEITKRVENEGYSQKHDALYDCLIQVEYLTKIFKSIKTDG